jgi:hypothetical protein
MSPDRILLAMSEELDPACEHKPISGRLPEHVGDDVNSVYLLLFSLIDEWIKYGLIDPYTHGVTAMPSWEGGA